MPKLAKPLTPPKINNSIPKEIESMLADDVNHYLRYLPFLYALPLRTNEDALSFFTAQVVPGSISMQSVRIGKAYARVHGKKAHEKRG